MNSMTNMLARGQKVLSLDINEILDHSDRSMYEKKAHVRNRSIDEENQD